MSENTICLGVMYFKRHKTTHSVYKTMPPFMQRIKHCVLWIATFFYEVGCQRLCVLLKLILTITVLLKKKLSSYIANLYTWIPKVIEPINPHKSNLTWMTELFVKVIFLAVHTNKAPKYWVKNAKFSTKIPSRTFCTPDFYAPTAIVNGTTNYAGILGT